jgi:hypothetical protein
LSARVVRAVLACARSTRKVAPTTIGLGLFRLVEAELSPPLSPVQLTGPSSWSSRFHFPASLGSTGITPLLRYYGCSDSRRAALRALGHEHRSDPDGSPCLFRPHFQPFCPQPPHLSSHCICARSLSLSARGCWPEDRTFFWEVQGIFPTWVMARASLLLRELAGRLGRIGFTVCHVFHVTSLRTGCSPPAALHPVLPRRSSLRSQTGDTSA